MIDFDEIEIENNQTLLHELKATESMNKRKARSDYTILNTWDEWKSIRLKYVWQDLISIFLLNSKQTN